MNRCVRLRTSSVRSGSVGGAGSVSFGVYFPPAFFPGSSVLLSSSSFCWAGGGFLVFSSASSARDRYVAPPPPASRQQAHPESGRALNSFETSITSLVGEGLYLGPSGLPVVRVESTGVVRDITPFEVEYYSDIGPGGPSLLRETGFNGVSVVPGPRGWGVWWTDDLDRKALEPDLYFDRLGWQARQREELGEAAAALTQILLSAERFDWGPWREGASGPVFESSKSFMARFGPEEGSGRWYEVPSRWVCSVSYQSALSGGVANTCPSTDLLVALDEAWVRLGVVAGHLEGLGRLGVVIDGLRPVERLEAAVVEDHASAYLSMLQDLRVLMDALASLKLVSFNGGLAIDVVLYRGV